MLIYTSTDENFNPFPYYTSRGHSLLKIWLRLCRARCSVVKTSFFSAGQRLCGSMKSWSIRFRYGLNSYSFLLIIAIILVIGLIVNFLRKPYAVFECSNSSCFF